MVHTMPCLSTSDHFVSWMETAKVMNKEKENFNKLNRLKERELRLWIRRRINLIS